MALMLAGKAVQFLPSFGQFVWHCAKIGCVGIAAIAAHFGTQRHQIPTNDGGIHVEAKGGSSSSRKPKNSAGNSSSTNKNQRAIGKSRSGEVSDSNEGGNWRKDPNKDVNLKDKSENFHIENVVTQLREAFRIAISIAQNYLEHHHENAAPELDWSQFVVTRYDFILVRYGGEIIRAAFPVEMQQTVRVRVRHGVFQEYNINVNLDNPPIRQHLEGPHGPHVGISVTPQGPGSSQREPYNAHIGINRNLSLPDRHRAFRTDQLAERGNPMRIPMSFLFNYHNRPAFPWVLERINYGPAYVDLDTRRSMSLRDINLEDETEKMKYPELDVFQ